MDKKLKSEKFISQKIEHTSSREMPIIIPIAPLTRTIRSEGAERVSGGASLVLADYIENTSHRISKKSRKAC